MGLLIDIDLEALGPRKNWKSKDTFHNSRWFYLRGAPFDNQGGEKSIYGALSRRFFFYIDLEAFGPCKSIGRVYIEAINI